MVTFWSPLSPYGGRGNPKLSFLGSKKKKSCNKCFFSQANIGRPKLFFLGPKKKMRPKKKT
jgi:hypothetical protein